MNEHGKLEFISVAGYLSSELLSPVRREYVNGQVFEMSGSSLKHNQIVKNLAASIDAHMKGSGCRSFVLDIKVRVEKCNSFYYPDLIVSCVPVKTSEVYLRSPSLIIEVLSPSTAAIDRREKLLAYQQLDSLLEYAVVYQSMDRIDVFSRDSELKSAIIYSGEHVTFNSLPNGPLSVPLKEVYADTIWGEPGPENDPWRVSECVGALEW